MDYENVMPIFGGYDEFGCFNIADFSEGDCLLVYRGYEKVRAVTTGVDTKNNILSFKTTEGRFSCHINDICMLAGPQTGWLTSYEH